MAMKPLRPEDLNRRVTIMRSAGQQPNEQTGGLTDIWQLGATVYAEVTGLTGRESTIGQALQGISMYQVRVRYGVDVGDADQLRYGSLDLNIRSIVDPDGAREQLVILADTASTLPTQP